MSTTQTQPQHLPRLRDFYQTLQHTFHRSHRGASEWLQSRSVSIEDFRTKSQQFLAATSLAGTMALQHAPVDAQVASKVMQLEQHQSDKLLSQITAEEREAILQKMSTQVQQPPGHLDKEQQLYAEQQLSDMLGFEVTVELEGNRLNHSIGIMGGEQHLRRFPNDSLEQHDAYLESGIAANRGAFGWFTENGELSEKAIQREKYYFAVQTMYLPNWNSEHPHLKKWYAFRKMIVINPAEKVAVVGVVGDAGPAAWVKKQFGGSPEVIREGKIWSSKNRGHIMLLFVDDPEDQVPLGPIDLSAPVATSAGEEQA